MKNHNKNNITAKTYKCWNKQTLIVNLMLLVIAISMIAIIIVLLVINPAGKPKSEILPAAIACVVVFLICAGLMIYFIVPKKVKPIKEQGMTRKKAGAAKFIFYGSKDTFIEKVKEQIGLFNLKYKTDFIIELNAGHLSIGLGRAGHGGGIWYEPTIIEKEHSIIIDGLINFVSYNGYEMKWWQNLIMWAFIVIPLCIAFSPVIVFRLIFIKPPQRKFINFMVKYVKCTEIKITARKKLITK